MSKTSNVIDMVGKRSGKLVVLRRGPHNPNHATWICRCDCGKTTVAAGNALRQETKRSCSNACGRRKYPATRRGEALSCTPAYKIWNEMRRRCNGVNHPHYADYGGRGITVCAHWHSFENFLADMGQPPKGRWIGRINNDGNYTPKNCRWETLRQQGRNKRNNVWIEAQGRRLILSDWARVLGCPTQIISVRLRRGWEPARAVTTPWVQLKGK